MEQGAALLLTFFVFAPWVLAGFADSSGLVLFRALHPDE
jgi:hypothetical protein